MTTREPERSVSPSTDPPASSGVKPASSPSRTPPALPPPTESTPTSLKAAWTPAPPRTRAVTIPPPVLDDVEEPSAQRPDPSFLPEKAIDEQLAELEAWTLHNFMADRAETTRFWLLRGTALISAVAAAAGGALHLSTFSMAAGTGAALAIAVEAAWPATTDRQSRRRAIRDLRELQHTLKLKWDKVRLAFPDPNTPKRVAHALALLDGIQAKREDIGKYLGDAAPTVMRPLST